MISYPRWVLSRVVALLLGGALVATSCTGDAVGAPVDRTCLPLAELERCWLTYVPSSAPSPAPLLIDMHGHSGTADGQRSFSGFRELADDEGFVAVWPEGLGGSWNAGERCCPPASRDAVDDVAFAREFVAVVAETTDIDLDRVYVTGFSNGCAMAQRLAADASDLIAAVGCMSHYLLDEPDPGYTPVPIMELHGKNDLIVDYERSRGVIGARQNRQAWAELNDCTGEPEPTWESGKSVAFAFLNCADGTEVALVSIDGGRHRLYAGSGTDIDTTRLAWDFMSRFRHGGE